MSKAENIETWVQQDAPNYGSSYAPSVRKNPGTLTFGKKWVPLISFGCLPLICAAIFAVQGSPRVFQWILKMIDLLF